MTKPQLKTDAKVQMMEFAINDTIKYCEREFGREMTHSELSLVLTATGYALGKYLGEDSIKIKHLGNVT